MCPSTLFYLLRAGSLRVWFLTRSAAHFSSPTPPPHPTPQPHGPFGPTPGRALRARPCLEALALMANVAFEVRPPWIWCRRCSGQISRRKSSASQIQAKGYKKNVVWAKGYVHFAKSHVPFGPNCHNDVCQIQAKGYGENIVRAKGHEENAVSGQSSR